MSRRKGQTGLVILAVLGLVVGSAAVYFAQGGQEKQASITDNFPTHFGQFGEDATVNDFSFNQVAFDDSDQDTAGNGTTSYSLNDVANETVQSKSDGSDNGIINLNNDDLESGSETVWNQTGDGKISSSDYTLYESNGSISLTSNVEDTNTQVTIDYNYMPEQTGTRVAEIYFEVDEGSSPAELTWNWAGNSISSGDTTIVDSYIKNTDNNDEIQLPQGQIQSGNTVQISQISEGDHKLFLYFDHSKGSETTPATSSGTTEEIGYLDFILNSNADETDDEPVEVEDFSLYADTTSP